MAAALERDRTIDITTTGRRTGKARRLEIWFHNVDGRIYITGMPGTRSWYANLLANPMFTFHLKETVLVDIDARARAVIDEQERSDVFDAILPRIGSTRPKADWMSRSPLVEVTF